MSNRYLQRKIYAKQRERLTIRENDRNTYIPPLNVPTGTPPIIAPNPFRWDVTQKAQLGTLLEGEAYSTPSRFLEESLACLARVIAFAGDNDLVFVGRSLESFYDLSCGLLAATKWKGRIHLLPFSTGKINRGRDKPSPEGLASYRAFLETRQLLPEQLIRPERRSITLVDIVASGNTFHYLIRLLHRFAIETHTDWQAVRRKIRIVGICWQKKTSPHTWRWQQQSSWVQELLLPHAVKNVALSSSILTYLADYQYKTTLSFVPSRWSNPENAARLRADCAANRFLSAMRLARSLVETGKTKECRYQFAKQLVRQREMRYEWFRKLVTEVYTSSTSKRS